MQTPRTRARSPAERIPLNLRLPNGPPVFVGRERELDALEAAIQRGPVAGVWGVGGLGKSSLVFHALHTRFAAQVPRTLMVQLTRSEPIDHALLGVARTLAESQGIPGTDWHSLLADRDALLATLIDLADGVSRGRRAEGTAHWIMIDDLHYADPVRAAEIVAQLARYARRSRWILVGRERLVPGDALGQAVALGAMSAVDLRALGERWGGTYAVDDQLVATAAGSPWRLGQLLAGARPEIEPGSGDLLDGLSAETATFLHDLAWIEAELPESILARFTSLPPAAVLAGLERRGLIERRPRGLRLHDVARGVLGPAQQGEAARARRLTAARVLCESAEPPIWLEGLRLFVSEGDAGQAVIELDARETALLEVGQILGVWRILAGANAPELESWRLRCATEIGDPQVVRTVPLPRSPSPADRVRWAGALLLQDRAEEAGLAGLDAQAAAIAAGHVGLAFDAGRIVGRAALRRGLPERALEAFEAQAPATSRQALQRDVDIAVCLVDLERRDLALERIRSVEGRLAEHAEIGDGALHFGVAWVLYQLGALRLAERAAERLVESLGSLGGHDAHSVRCLVLSVGIAIDRGELARAAERLDKLSPFARRSPVHVVYASLIRALIRIETGSFEGLRAEILEVVEGANRTSREDLKQNAAAQIHRIAVVLGDPPEGPARDLAPNESASQDYLLLWEAVHRAHWGDMPFDPATVQTSVPEIQVLRGLSVAWTALGTGRVEVALRAVEEATVLASATGYGTLEALVREAAGVAEILAGAPAGRVAERATALATIAVAQGMTPLRIQAELLGLLASSEAFEPARIEAIAGDMAAPVAARRARALLGEEIALGAIDRAVVSAARVRLGCTIETVIPGARGAGGSSAGAWGLDDRTQSVWLPGRTVSLAERPLLWRILCAVAEGGGAVDKEVLVIGAWEVRSYNPLRDDARMHSAVRMLRRSIEEDPANPVRFVTTEEGYAFGRGAPVRRLVVSRRG